MGVRLGGSCEEDERVEDEEEVVEDEALDTLDLDRFLGGVDPYCDGIGGVDGIEA